jgi:cytidyltransferase-like protein
MSASTTMPFALLERYRHKIVTPEHVAKAIGPRPRAKYAIMCHGVFDVVHPGHVRHLLYAKSKADILIASITADRHITKGTHRPHVPQDLRAVNLAAFEMVDYVIVDRTKRRWKISGSSNLISSPRDLNISTMASHRRPRKRPRLLNPMAAR